MKIYPDSATRKIFSKTKTIKHKLVHFSFIYPEGPKQGSWHVEVLQRPYLQKVLK